MGYVGDQVDLHPFCFQQTTRPQFKEFEVLDEQFHSIIANAAYNDVLLKFAQNINKLRGSKLWGNMKYKSLQKEGRITRYKVEHKAIYLELVNRDFNEVDTLPKNI
ncbi:FCD domain-containing protein [Gudongella oleilytica]|jgi:DNA-binding GntR family transcriptional regulator|uniref:FCD domain-containing protein n=1 Tax=Gudongella oleilytica TaxID=1582259 RepID=UPI000FF89E83|nr:FCD domain-containing protein [Gudongella oleilytica]